MDVKRLCPLFIIKPGTIAREDIQRVEDQCGICIIECREPEAARFLDRPPDSTMSDQAVAALEMMRIIVDGSGNYAQNISRGDIGKEFVKILLKEKHPSNQPVPSVPRVKK